MGSYLSFDKGRNVLGLSSGPMLPLRVEDLALVLESGRLITLNFHYLAQASWKGCWDATS